jgi:TonB family protein
MENLLAFFYEFGSVSWVNFWMPLGIWTLIAAFFMVLLRAVTAHPTLHYYMRIALLLSLPIGIIIMNLTWLTPQIEPLSVFYPIVVLYTDVASIAVIPASESFTLSAMPWVGGLNFLLLIVGFVAILRHAYQHILLTRHVAILKSASDKISGLAQSVAQKCGLRKSVQVFISEQDDIPYTYGLNRPVIVLPSEHFSTEKLESILTHEIMHIRRSDFAIQWTEQFIRAVFLFHPLVHLLVRDLQKYREMSCDADVISGMYVNPRLYASLLLEFVSSRRNPALSVMISMATPTSKIKERIFNMQNYPKSPKSGRNIRLMSILSGIVLFITTAGIVACSDINRSSSEVESTVDLNTELNKGTENELGTDVFLVVERMPEPIGGMQTIYEKIRYPELARKAGIEGRVVVQFVVDEQGNVVNPEIIRGIGGGCDEAALNAIRGVQFTPGMQRGRAVKVQFQIPIVFRLNNGDSPPPPPPQSTSEIGENTSSSHDLAPPPPPINQ